MLAAENNALDAVNEALRGDGTMTDAQKAAIKVLNVVAKNRANVTSRVRVGLSVAQFLQDPKELHKYMAITRPEIKKLTRKKQ